MYFNCDIYKQPQEVLFLRKVEVFHTAVLTNNISVAHCSTHKYLDTYLNEILNFGHLIKEKIANTKIAVGNIKLLHNFVLHQALLTIYKSFIRPNLDSKYNTEH